MNEKNFYDELSSIPPTAALSFLVQQAAHIEAEVYRVEYPQYKYTELVPLDNSAPDFAQVVGFKVVDSRGELQLLSSNGTDIPTVDIAYSQGFHEIKTAALGYTYTFEELGRAKYLGHQLDAERAICVRDAVEQGLNQIYLLGHKDVGEGLYKSKNVSVEVVPNTITQLIEAIPTHGTQPIVSFFMNGYNQVYLRNTKTVHRPNTCVIPSEIFQLLTGTMLSPHNSSNVTVLEFLKHNLSSVNFVDDVLLTDAGTEGTGRIVWYKKDMRVVRGHDVMPLSFMEPATADNVNFKVPAVTRTGGTEIRIPKAFHYMDGI